ncbi:MAG: DUF4139 domain-containing protein [Bacteroidota bacterium]
MKKTLCIMLLVSIFLSVKAQDKPKVIKSKIKEVTVFFNGAQITQSGDIILPAGQTTIMFENLTQYITPQSIQIKGEGNFDILSVVHQINYLKSQEKSPEVLRIEDSIQILSKNLTVQQTYLTVYSQEEGMLIANKDIGGDQNGVKIAELKEAMEYFRTRMMDIKTNQMNIQDKINIIQKRIAILNNQLAALNSYVTEPTSEILVSVNAETQVNAKLILSYYITNAGWTPTYDLRAVNVTSPMELNFRANVHQNTGTDWNAVKLTLSTGNPLQNGVKPILNPWYLSFINLNGYENYKTDKAPAAFAQERLRSENNMEETGKTETKNGSSADYTVVNETQTNIEYDISIPYSIPADGKNYMVEIQKNTLTATYEYYCAPKLDNDVFLVAHVCGWEKYNIVSGEMNLFFEGTYVGKSYIDTRITTDTLDFSLGVDKSISLRREKVQDLTSVKVIGTNKKETFTYTINVRNKKSMGIDILIEDQIPISTDKDIEIEALETSLANYDKDYGKLSWKFQLKAAETKTLKLSYSVKYPKDKQINLY